MLVNVIVFISWAWWCRTVGGEIISNVRFLNNIYNTKVYPSQKKYPPCILVRMYVHESWCLLVSMIQKQEE